MQSLMRVSLEISGWSRSLPVHHNPLTALFRLQEQQAAFDAALDKADVVITTGGTSMGEADLVKVSRSAPFSRMRAHH